MRDAKQCPRCKIAISKISGCNKMTCSNCGHYFCYQCNFAIVGYDHFKPGACDLISLEEIDRWEAQMNPGGRRVQADAPAPAPLPEGRYRHPCPTCGKRIPKIGNNNHILCGSCQTHFCALCRKTLQSPENFTTFWSQGMQATYCRSRLTLPYAPEAGITLFLERKKCHMCSTSTPVQFPKVVLVICMYTRIRIQPWRFLHFSGSLIFKSPTSCNVVVKVNREVLSLPRQDITKY